MSERKVLSKYYPPDFDPSKITRQRKPKDAAHKVQTVRLMAPFSIKCNACGEYIYKGRKFNARKETTDESYYAIKIFRFYIRCTRCSAEILFKTDPRNMDYTCEKGATRNFEPWREAKLAEETDEERLDRLEREEAERDAMAELEMKTSDAKTEIAVADALDEIRMRNARLDRAQHLAKHHLVNGNVGLDDEVARQDREDEEASRQAFRTDMDEGVRRVPADDNEDDNRIPAGGENASSYSFARSKKKKKDYGSALGIKRK